MAKRRQISQDIAFSDDCNSLTDFEERVFLRLLTITDDFGVIPSNTVSLRKRIGFDSDRQPEFDNAVIVLLDKYLLVEIEYLGVRYYMFNPTRFDKEQSFVRSKRTRSEYIDISADTREEFSEQITFLEIRRISRNSENFSPHKDIKNKDKEKDKERGSGGEKAEIEIPEDLLVLPEFREAWADWEQAQKEKRQKMTPSRRRHQFKRLQKIRDPVAAIRYSIAQGYTGIFEESKPVTAKDFNGQSLTERRINFDPAKSADSLRRIGEKILARSTPGDNSS